MTVIAAANPVATDPYQDEEGLWHVDDIEICATGIEYNLASGPTTFTESMLADAVKAAADDVAVKSPRIKLGHSSKYNEVLIGDAEQAFGRVEAMHLSDNKQTIIGNFVGTPEWLAKVLPIAYPGRSIEGSVGVETVTGNQYELVITAVGTLGVVWPGCSVLEDLPMWYGADTPDDAEIIESADESIAASGGGMKFKSKSEFEAAVDVSLIRRKFYNDGPGLENWAWWIRGERYDSADGYNLIVDMGDGELCRFPVTVDGADVEFGEYTLVTEEYPDKAVAASAVLAGMAMIDPDMVVYASRADSPDIPSREGAQMDEATRSALASRLGLPKDATEAQINAKMAEGVLASEPEAEDKPDADEKPEDKPEVEEEAETETPPEVEAGADGTVRLDKETYLELQRGAKLAAKHETEAVTARIDTIVNAAVEDGRVPPARREHWKKALAADFDGTKATLDSLEKGLVPLKARGTSGGDTEGIQTGGEGEGTGLPDSWFPEIGAMRASAAKPRQVLQAKEG